MGKDQRKKVPNYEFKQKSRALHTKGSRFPQSDKRDVVIFVNLRIFSSGERMSSSKNTRGTLGDIHMEHGLPGLTRW